MVRFQTLAFVFSLMFSAVGQAQMMMGGPSSPQEDVTMTLSAMEKITGDSISFAKNKKGRGACYSASALTNPSLHLRRVIMDFLGGGPDREKAENQMRLLQLRIGLLQGYCQSEIPEWLALDAEKLLNTKVRKTRASFIENGEAIQILLSQIKADFTPSEPQL